MSHRLAEFLLLSLRGIAISRLSYENLEQITDLMRDMSPDEYDKAHKTVTADDRLLAFLDFLNNERKHWERQGEQLTSFAFSTMHDALSFSNLNEIKPDSYDVMLDFISCRHGEVDEEQLRKLRHDLEAAGFSLIPEIRKHELP